jgi:hypothetical protein
MKKTVFTSAIIMALVFITIRSANAQNFHVTWDGISDSACYCHNNDNCYYRIDATIVNECVNPWVSFPVTPYFADNEADEATYPHGYSCIDSTQEPCYLIIVEVKKICSDGHGGFVVLCSGRQNKWAKCADFSSGDIEINVGILH